MGSQECARRLGGDSLSCPALGSTGWSFCSAVNGRPSEQNGENVQERREGRKREGREREGVREETNETEY